MKEKFYSIEICGILIMNIRKAIKKHRVKE